MEIVVCDSLETHQGIKNKYSSKLRCGGIFLVGWFFGCFLRGFGGFLWYLQLFLEPLSRLDNEKVF